MHAPGRSPMRLGTDGRLGVDRRWILVNAVAITAMVNLVVNAAVAWLTTIGVRRVPLWATPIVGGPSTIADTLGTLFVLPLVTCVLVSAAVRRDVRAGRLLPLERGRWRRLSHLPVGAIQRGLVLGSICLAALSAPTVAVLLVVHLGNLSDAQFVLFKALFAVALGLVATPVIAVAALARERPPSDLRGPFSASRARP